MSEASAAVNPAVLRCLEAYLLRYNAEFAKRPDRVLAELAAEAEYRRAMPHLGGRKSIQAFIACVGHGMLVGIIPHDRGAKCLYAAQVALSALRTEPRPVGRPSKAAKSNPPESPRTASEPPQG